MHIYVLIQAAESEELHDTFKLVLDLLKEVEESYRLLHGKACFYSDKHPLYIVDEFKGYIMTMGKFFNLVPMPDHPLLIAYDDVYDETVRQVSYLSVKDIILFCCFVAVNQF
jgi:hypothetical protein